MATNTIADDVKSIKKDIAAKKKKRSHSGCCDIEYEGSGGNLIRNVGISKAENGIVIDINYNHKLIAKTAEEAGEAITEIFKD